MSLTVSCDGCYTSKETTEGFNVMTITIDKKIIKTLHWCNACLLKKEHLSIWATNPFYIKPQENVPYTSPEGT